MAEVAPVTLWLSAQAAGSSELLRTAVGQPQASGMAVATMRPDAATLWGGGCACCAPRDDVARALRVLLPRARRGEVGRVVIETAGVADPGPILATLLSDTVAASAYLLDTIIVVVDAAAGAAALDRQPKAVLQIAAADRIVVTNPSRTDSAALTTRLRGLNHPVSGGTAADILTTRLRGLNPFARLVMADADPAALLAAGVFDPAMAVPELPAWLGAARLGATEPDAARLGTARRDAARLNAARLDAGPRDGAGLDAGWRDAAAFDAASVSAAPGLAVPAPLGLAAREADIRPYCLTFDRPLPRSATIAWLERLILMHGDSVLRMKAILHLDDEPRPVAVHSIRHLLHPPVTLAGWPGDGPRSSHVAFITRGLSLADLQTGQPARAAAQAAPGALSG